MNKFSSLLIVFLKGFGMGTANVIPGVSGGTIAFITGIFERLINAIKSFDLIALKLILTGKFKEFIEKTDLYFLISLLIGVALAIVTLARVFDYLFINYPVYIWSYFFGLVLASVYFVGKGVSKWNFAIIMWFIAGTAIAFFISLLNPARPNDNFLYLILCGIVAICSMILPGLSGSFVLLLMGNYQLVAIDAINNMNFAILLPVAIGAIAGIIAFSHLLSWVFKKFRNQTIAALTGFVLGSLSVLWPWKNELFLTDVAGNFILKDGNKIISGYHKYFPADINQEVLFALLFVVLGIASIWITETLAENRRKE